MDAVDFDSTISESCLNVKTGKVCCFTDEEIRDAKSKEELTNPAEWYKEAVKRAKNYLENEQDYLPLPSKYDFNEYHVMQRFIDQVTVKDQADLLYHAINGKGAFHRFRQTLERIALLDSWYRFKEHELKDYIESWCSENDVPFE